MKKNTIDCDDEGLMIKFHDKSYNKIVDVAEARRQRRVKRFELWLVGKADNFLSLK